MRHDPYRKADSWHQAQPAVAALVLLVALPNLLAACKDGTAQHPVPVSEVSEPRLTFPDGKARDSGVISSQTDEEGLFDNRLHQTGGDMDSENHFAATVMVATEDPSKASRAPRCSGVLLNPRVVLTAAHCVCQPQQASGDVNQMLVDASACAPRAFATTVIYGAVRDKDFKEGTTEMRFHAYEGAVRVHPEFELRTGLHGDQISSRADLALIVLDEPVAEPVGSTRLPNREVQPGEKLIMAGYSHDDPRLFGGVYGIRYIRKHKVIKTLPAGGGRVLYDRPNPFVALGYAGGACIREDKTGQWLVGIAARDSEEELSCTSVYVFLGWLRAEVTRAERRQSTVTPAPGAPE